MLRTEAPDRRAYADLARDISGFASNLLDGRVIGAGGDRR
jgi:hypothetical protein